MIKITNECNMELMARYPDNYFDLAIVDPPYGINIGNAKKGKWGASKLETKDWDLSIPQPEYFEELKRVSKNQIIFGANYFPDVFPTRGYLIWDKGAGFKDRDFAECELAFTSFDRNAKIFKHDPLARRDYIGKIHPTQKPIPLYEFILMNYAKEGDKILDTHLGSGSIAIACHNLNFELTACELDNEYYNAALKRLKQHQAQLTIF